MILGSDPVRAHVQISLVLTMLLRSEVFSMFCFGICRSDLFSKMIKTDFYLVLVGGQHVGGPM